MSTTNPEREDVLSALNEVETESKSAGPEELEAAGYVLIPLRPESKIPAIENWPSTTYKTFPFRTLLNKNYGVSLQEDDLVVDVDPRNFEKGDRPLKRLLEVLGTDGEALSKTFIVQTGGGGFHIYLKKPKDVAVQHSLKAFPGIEFKSAGRQVVGPGSIHPETKRKYQAVNNSKPTDVRSAPASLLTVIKKVHKAAFAGEDGVSAKAVGIKEWQEDKATQDRFISFLQGTAPLSIEGKKGDETAFKVAAFGRDLGLSPLLAYELMAEYWNPRCTPPWEGAELESKVINAYKYGKKEKGGSHPASDFDKIEEKEKDEEEKIAWQLTENGGVKKCFYNLLNYMKLPESGLRGLFRYNEFTAQVEFSRPAPWHRGKMPTMITVTDADLKILKGYLAVRFSFEVAIATIEEAITVVAHKPENKFHPVRDYLGSLKWDGVERLDTWLERYAGATDSQYVRAVSRKMLCAAVARVYQPGIQYDHVVILEGKQGIGKSGLCRILGGEWAADFTIDPHNKDTIASLQGKWIVEMAEMAVFKRADMEALKAFVTRPKDKARLAYGRLAQDYPRQCIFVGTINPEADGGYLTDTTGNRRFWPVALNGRVKFAELKAVRDQLWAEAVVKYKAGEELYMSKHDLNDAALKEAERRQIVHPWADTIADWLDLPEVYLDKEGKEAYRVREFVTTREIYLNALSGNDAKMDRRVQLNIANSMKQIGWHPGVKRVGERVVRGYSKGGVRGEAKSEVKAAEVKEEKSVWEVL